MGRPLILVGSGGFGRETAEVVRALNAADEARGARPPWNLLGYVDDDPGRWGATVSGVPVLGAVDEVAAREDVAVVVCTGRPGNYRSKRAIVDRLKLEPARFATLVHPAAVVAGSCVLAEGTVVMAGVVATADVRVGAHVGLMPHVVLTHDDVLGDFVTVGAGARLAGAVEVAEGAYLGSGCLVREHRRVGAWAMVGMGAVVTRDVPAGETWVGVPARRLAGTRTGE